MTDISTFSTSGVERIHAEGAAVIDLSDGWPTVEQVLGGEPGPVWDVDAPLDRPIDVGVLAPDGRLDVRATTIRLLVGADGQVTVVGLTRPYDDRAAATDEVRRTAAAAGLETGPTQALLARLEEGPVTRRRRRGLRAGEALGVRVGLTVHRLPARDDVPPLEVLEWSITPLDAETPSDGAAAGDEGREWLRL